MKIKQVKFTVWKDDGTATPAGVAVMRDGLVSLVGVDEMLTEILREGLSPTGSVQDVVRPADGERFMEAIPICFARSSVVAASSVEEIEETTL